MTLETTVEQTHSKNTLGAKIAGAIVGAGATIACIYTPSACIYTPSLIPYVAGAGAAGVAGAAVAADCSPQQAKRRRSFVGAGLLTAAVLTGGYFVGRSQSDVTNVLQQEQTIEVRQADGRITPFENQNGTYVPLERRVGK